MDRPIGDRPREGYLLDYKEDVSDRFLRSVAAFANTFGGLLIVGVTEIDGRPDKLAGVSVQGEWKTRIASMVAANLFPCPQFEIAECALPTDA
ncbi:MAG: ATP-binding protein [Candidatus Acidiferrum sp.]